MFFCQKCCRKCLCVPPGYYGNKAVCPCYNNWKTKEGGPKCPWTIINFPSLVSFFYIICIKCYALGIALTIYYMFLKLWLRRGKMDFVLSTVYRSRSQSLGLRKWERLVCCFIINENSCLFYEFTSVYCGWLVDENWYLTWDFLF